MSAEQNMALARRFLEAQVSFLSSIGGKLRNTRHTDASKRTSEWSNYNAQRSSTLFRRWLPVPTLSRLADEHQGCQAPAS
jgi:hypothetical protein